MANLAAEYQWGMALKAMVHTNAMHHAFSEPVLSGGDSRSVQPLRNVVAVQANGSVGSPTKGGEVQLWGDFTCLKARVQVPKHSILWLVEVDAPAFQEARTHVQHERPEAVSQQHVQALWSAQKSQVV